MNTEQYFKKLENETKKEFELASQARKNGVDPSEEPEIYIAKNLSEKVEGLIGLDGLADIVKKVTAVTESDVAAAFKIAEQVAKNEADIEKAADIAIRAGLAFLTQGSVAAPLEGIAKVKLHKNSDNTQYISVYFAGPIRAAGGTAEALCIIIADYVRKVLNLAPYQPTQQEVSRYYEEIQWYGRRTHLQYMPSEEEVKIIIRNTPVCIDGEPTETYEVANFRDLGRVPSNRVRGGMCLVVAEGVAQKAPKLWKRMKPIQDSFGMDWSWLEGLLVKKASTATPDVHEKISETKLPGFEWVGDLTGEGASDIQEIIEQTGTDGRWDWLDTLIDEPEAAVESGGSKKFLNEVPAGRPVFSHYSRQGGFRLRYGRTRASGYAAAAMNPATMHTLGEFIAIGTQVRLEMPGKAAIITPCDTIEGPLVRLTSGEVLRISTIEQAVELEKEVEAIIQLGDILISAGDFLENNQTLAKSAYCEEWWGLQLAEKSKTDAEIFQSKPPSFEKAVELSKKYNIPFHPIHTFYWNSITVKDLVTLAEAINPEKNTIKNTKQTKKILEHLGVFHLISENQLVLDAEHFKALLFSLDFPTKNLSNVKKQTLHSKNVIKIINNLCPVEIKNRAPTYIGARMGRPEKAKPRKMVPPPNAIFPTGGRRGRIRDIVKIAKTTQTSTPEISKYKCEACGTQGIFPRCSTCNSKTILITACPRCGRSIPAEECPVCGVSTTAYETQSINFKTHLDSALTKLGVPSPEKVKGVLGMSSKSKTPEALEKGILRARQNLYVFKDGTIRFDSTDAPLTHFTPDEVQAPVAKLRKLGYTEDWKGKPLETGDQLLPLKPQDVVVSDYGEESAAIYLLAASKFIDELLEKYYKLKPYYKCKKKQDLIGKMIIGLAPHTSTGIIGRLIGFTKARVGYAHPAFHDAKRRDCDGDEDAVLLLLDSFLNFSKSFLPDRRGGRMDAPLVISTRLTALELDDEVYDVDIVDSYGLDFYNSTEQGADPNTIGLKTVESVLEEEDALLNWPFTHHTKDINAGPIVNTYSKGEMLDKLEKQLGLAEKSFAVDADDVAERILSSHFLPDIKGNLRTFAKQKLRCTKCNTKYRRPPLSGVCSNCGNKLTMTVHEGTIKKYLDVSKRMIEKYNINPYLAQQITMYSKSIDSIFGIEAQKKLGAF
jgi:DNA polymerase II large subunit|tara:strand:- start:13563 stop:17060 length:3498 start_codon:yes stop_codon:yes gene_type:complete